MFANFLLGLREGLEASLVVSILIAYVVKSGRREQLKWIWVGVALALALAIGFTLALGLQSRKLDQHSQELLGGVMSVIAVVFVTWMIFWMAGAAKSIAGDLRGRIDDAAGRPLAVALVAFLAVGREGMETGAFLWAFAQTGTGRDQAADAELTWTPFLSATLGILLAAFLGYLIYKGAVTINLTKFFTWTGGLLIVVAAGVLSYGIHEFQSINVLPGTGRNLYDISAHYDDGSWYGTLLGGMFNLKSAMTYLEAAAYVAYLAPVLYFFLRSIRGRSAASAPKAPTPNPVSAP